MFEPLINLKGEKEMDFESGILYNRRTTPEQREVTSSIPQSFGNTGELPEVDIPSFIDVTKEIGKPNVPIYELKADEDARAKLKSHKNDANYEELVARVKQHEPYFADKDEIDHRAIAVILDNDVMFDELERALKALDDTLSEIDKEPNKWEQHGAMFSKLREDMHYAVNRRNDLLDTLNRLM